jgi:hypothetical protein
VISASSINTKYAIFSNVFKLFSSQNFFFLFCSICLNSQKVSGCFCTLMQFSAFLSFYFYFAFCLASKHQKNKLLKKVFSLRIKFVFMPFGSLMERQVEWHFGNYFYLVNDQHVLATNEQLNFFLSYSTY